MLHLGNTLQEQLPTLYTYQETLPAKVLTQTANITKITHTSMYSMRMYTSNIITYLARLPQGGQQFIRWDLLLYFFVHCRQPLFNLRGRNIFKFKAI